MADSSVVARPGTALTAAERRVLEAMIAADSEAHAAEALGVSPHTVHTHLRNIRSRLGVRTTRQAIANVRHTTIVRETAD